MSQEKEPVTIQRLAFRIDNFSEETAIIMGDVRLTFAEMAEQTNRIAGHLLSLGIRPGDVVGIRMLPGIEATLSIFGVVKSGAAYLLMDTKWPEKRLEFLRQDCNVRLEITSDSFPEFLQGPCLDARELTFAGPQELCAIYYTSGTTGMPKGACHTQEEFARTYLAKKENRYIMEIVEHCTTVMNVTDHAFIAGTLMMFGAMPYGKTMVIVTQEERFNIELMARRMESEKADYLFLTPSYLNVCMENERFCRALGNIRLLCTGAEKVPQPLADKASRLLSEGAVFLNLYGTSECPPVAFTADICRQRVRMGRAQYAVEYCFIDEEGREVPAGEKGILCIRDLRSCKGFTRHAASAERRFYTAPDGRRYFITQDICVEDENGELTYLGRADRMIKRNGVRIDLGEIEEEMCSVAGIVEAAAVFSENRDSSQDLVAFYVSDREISNEEFRRELGKSLPAYMLPRGFFRLSAMPRTERGKTDYVALAALPAELDSYLPPSTLEEELLCQVLGEVLKLERVSVGDSFLGLGGDSLSAMLVLDLLAEKGYALGILDLNRAETIEELAKLLRPYENAGGEERLFQGVRCDGVEDLLVEQAIKLLGGDRLEAVLPLLPGQDLNAPEGGALLEQWLHKYWVVRGSVTREQWQERLGAVLEAHPGLRSKPQRLGGKYYLTVLRKGELPCDYKDVRVLAQEGQAISGAQENVILAYRNSCKRGRDSQDLLLRIGCFVLSENTYAIDMEISHLICDGLSMQLLADELSGFAQIRPDGFYRYHTLFESFRTLSRAKDFWQSALAGVKPGLLPFGGWEKRGQLTLYKKVFSREETSVLKTLCRQRRTSLPVYLYYLYAKAAFRQVSGEELLLCIITSGRIPQIQDSQGVVGELIHPLPVRIRREDTLEAFRDHLSGLSSPVGMHSVDEIFELAGFSRRLPMIFAPVSEIFPADNDHLLFQKTARPDGPYKIFEMEDGCLSLEFVCDGFAEDEKAVGAILSYMENVIKSGGSI